MPYSKGFLVTGDYVVGGVDLPPQNNVDGLVTGEIPISGIPADANVIAAYLYWEVIHPFPVNPADPDASNPAKGVKFRGQPISVSAIKATTKPISGSGSLCWGAAGQGSFAVSMLRANVLSFLPKQLDSQGKWTGKYIVNSAELPLGGKHTVSLREKTGANAVQSAGATLFLVYRVSTPTEPLRKIVVFDGLYTAHGTGDNSTAESEIMSQKLRGFYKSTGQSARITHLVGTGGNNQNERITVQSQNAAITIGPPPNSNDPFPQTSPNSDRSWATANYILNGFMPGTTDPNDRYGETVTTTVQTSNSNPAACRAWGAVFFSTEVADIDDDGLPDGLEDAPNGLKDPNDAELPKLNAMGAGSTYLAGPDAGNPHPDFFVEFNAMWAAPNTTYGSAEAPYPNTTAACYNPLTQSCTDTLGHHHFPTPEDLKRIGDRYAAHGITAHFDVGDVAAYHALGQVQHSDWVDDYQSTAADQYLVGNGVGTNVAGLARGGEVIKEVACDENNPECVFDDYPGTVGWKKGLVVNRDAPVGDNGQELNPDLTDPNDPNFNWLTSTVHRTRFDRVRKPYFHYALHAHTRGTPISDKPCLVSGQPADYPPNTTTCATDNPQFHIPSGSGGLADLPGRNVLVTLGLWDELVGRPFARASTIFHEFGHNLSLWHFGQPADFGDAQTPTVIEPACKPNFLSSMSYLYQLFGLFDENGKIQLDYSHGALDPLDENGLADGDFLTTPKYRRAWYAPANSQLAVDQGVLQAATRFCSGATFGPGQPAVPMARVLSDTDSFDPQTGQWGIDWDGDGVLDAASQDANFDGAVNATLSGYVDWANIRLDQISANGITGGSDDLVFYGGSDELIFYAGSDELISFSGSDDLVYYGGSDDLVSFSGSDDLVFYGGSDDLVNFSGSDDLVSFSGSDDLVNFSGSDDLVSFSGSNQPELTYAAAQGLGRAAPYELSACNVGTPGCDNAPSFTPSFHRVKFSFTASTVGHIDHYQVQKKRASAPDSAYTDVAGTATLTTNHIIDPEELPPVPFVYRVRAHFDQPPGQSGWAVLAVPITPVNDLPVPQPDSYTALLNTPLITPAPGVLGVNQNSPGADKSSDSPSAYVGRQAVLVNNVTSGTLLLNANGGFTFTPASGFVGTVTFTYKCNDGPWPGDSAEPLNGKDVNNTELFSNPVTVTITVKKKK